MCFFHRMRLLWEAMIAAVIKMNIAQYLRVFHFSRSVLRSCSKDQTSLWIGNQRGKSQGDSQNSGKPLTTMLAGLTQKWRRNFHAYIKKFSFNHSRSFRQSANSVLSFIFIFSHSHSTSYICWEWMEWTCRHKNSWEWKISRVHCHCHQCREEQCNGICQKFEISFSFLRGLRRTAEIKWTAAADFIN